MAALNELFQWQLLQFKLGKGGLNAYNKSMQLVIQHFLFLNSTLETTQR